MLNALRWLWFLLSGFCLAVDAMFAVYWLVWLMEKMR